MRPAAALDSYEAYCSTKNLSPQTVRWYRTHLSAFARWLDQDGLIDLNDLTSDRLYRFFGQLRTTPGANGRGKRGDHSLHAYAQIIKTFLVWAAEEELVSGRLVAKVQLPKVEKKVIRTLSRAQYHALTVAAANEFLPWLMHRDLALLAVLIDTGVRAAEACALVAEDVKLLRGDPHLIVKGKGRKERAVGPIGSQTEKLLRSYLTRHRPRSVDCPVVFLSKFHQPLTPSGLDKTLYRLERWAGPERFEGVRLSAHTFRHTYAVNFLRSGGGIHDLSLLLGHGNVAVTQRYLTDYQIADARRGRSVLDSWS